MWKPVTGTAPTGIIRQFLGEAFGTFPHELIEIWDIRRNTHAGERHVEGIDKISLGIRLNVSSLASSMTCDFVHW
jgi:hypothetical protein